jgi:lambda repressor-like predicted transcriptional regulator
MVTPATKIKIEMLKAGVSGAEIARRLKVSRHAVYHVIAGRNRTPRIRKAIARALGMKVEELWPTNGASRSDNTKISTRRLKSEKQKREIFLREVEK